MISPIDIPWYLIFSNVLPQFKEITAAKFYYNQHYHIRLENSIRPETLKFLNYFFNFYILSTKKFCIIKIQILASQIILINLLISGPNYLKVNPKCFLNRIFQSLHVSNLHENPKQLVVLYSLRKFPGVCTNYY